MYHVWYKWRILILWKVFGFWNLSVHRIKCEYPFVIHIFIIKFLFYVDGSNILIIELYFLIKTILDFILYSTAFVSRSHDHPSRARILTSAGLPFSNNLLIARPRNSVEKDPAEWTVWSLTLEWWSKSHGYIVVQ